MKKEPAILDAMFGTKRPPKVPEMFANDSCHMAVQKNTQTWTIEKKNDLLDSGSLQKKSFAKKEKG